MLKTKLEATTSFSGICGKTSGYFRHLSGASSVRGSRAAPSAISLPGPGPFPAPAFSVPGGGPGPPAL